MFSQKLKDILDEMVLKYETPSFIERDPISIPHMFKRKEDIEISSFLTSILSFGRRESILKKAHVLMKLLQNEPYNFILYATPKDLENIKNFYYRMLNGDDFFSIILAIKKIYKEGGMEHFFASKYLGEPLILRIARFYSFIRSLLPKRCYAHVSSIDTGSAGKRANMFLRWMVRSSFRGVDFGLWDCIDSSELFLPLDVHVGNVARRLGLTTRRQNDAKTVIEITNILRKMCPDDPIKYDFALFSIGISSGLENEGEKLLDK